MKKIYALSRYRFCELIDDRNITDENVREHNTAFIQILNAGDEGDLCFKLKSNNDNVICFRFDDADEAVDLPGYVPVVPMEEWQAQLLVEFIKRNEHKATFIVHCLAGVSRSGGVTRFLAEHFDVTLRDFAEYNPYVRPNQRIVSMLREKMKNYESKSIEQGIIGKES
jgi:predicted protein tyrosine phosphatase